MKIPETERTVSDVLQKDRSHSNWSDCPVDPDVLRRVYDLAKFGPTSTNTNPMRVHFAISQSARSKVLEAVADGNKSKVAAAPVTAIIAHDLLFYEEMPKLFPHAYGRARFADKPAAHLEETAFRNGTLQAGYFLMAARSLGLDCGPLSGFDADQINSAFFPDGRFKVNFLCNLGCGSNEGMFPRLPRLDFDDACAFV